MLQRKTPLRRTPLRSGGLLRKVAAKVKRRDTGPDAATRALVAARSGGRCEMPNCYREASDVHHRLNRKAGGRRGEMAQRINRPAWLLHVCRPCHEWVTSPSGEALIAARAYGWLLREGEDARDVPVMLRHDTRRVRLDDLGGWWWTRDGVRYHEAGRD